MLSISRISVLFLVTVSRCLANDTAYKIMIRVVPDDPGVPRIGQGVNSFLELLLMSDVWADKSLFIKDLFEDENKYFLISCPSQWGKTVNLDMIKVFFEMELDRSKAAKRHIITGAYNYFVNRYFIDVHKQKIYSKESTLISAHLNFIEEHLGKYPVIYITFKSVFRDRYANLITVFMYEIRKLYGNHYYITDWLLRQLRNDSFSKDEKLGIRETLNLFKNIRFDKGDLSETELTKSLYLLIKLLHDYHGRKVIILIDDYHIPWSDLLHNFVLSPKERKKFFEFYAGFIDGTFQNNSYIQKAVLTGLYLPFEDVRNSTLNQFVDCNLINGKFMRYYGTNDKEFNILADLYKWNRELRDRVTRWYNGYSIPTQNLQIYNSYSISEFAYRYHYIFHKTPFKGYWVEKCNIQSFLNPLLEVDAFRAKIYNLINEQQEVPIEFDKTHISWKTLEMMHGRAYFDDIDISEFVDQALVQLHLYGYLSIRKQVNNTSNMHFVKIPNYEVLQLMYQLIGKYYTRKFNFDKMYEFFPWFLKNETREFFRSDSTDGICMLEGFETYLQHEHSVFEIIEKNQTNVELLLFDLLCYSAIDTRCEYKISYPPTVYTNKPHLVMFSGNRVGVFRIAFNASTTRSILQQLKSNVDIKEIKKFNQNTKKIKYIAVNVLRNGSRIESDVVSEFQHI